MYTEQASEIRSELVEANTAYTFNLESYVGIQLSSSPEEIVLRLVQPDQLPNSNITGDN